VRARRRWRPVLRQAHAWTGFLVSILIAAMALSGSVLLFKDDLRRLGLSSPAVPATVDPRQLGAIANAAQQAFGGQLRFVRFASEDLGIHEVALKEGGAYLNGDGRIVERWSGRRPLDWLVEFHHRLMLDKTGANLLGVVGIVALALTLSGLVLWWPTRRKFRPNPVPARNHRSALIASHRDLGALLAPILVLSFVTAIPMGLSQLSQPMFGFSRAPPKVDAVAAPTIDWTRVMPAVTQALPDAVPRQVTFPNGGKAASVRLRRPDEWHRQGFSIAYVSPEGAIMRVIDAQGEGAGARAYARLFPLHTGQAPWAPLRFLLLAGGLGLALIALLGAEAFRRRLLGSRR
jgi:uncharacterized iron-regulated membrane protein